MADECIGTVENETREVVGNPLLGDTEDRIAKINAINLARLVDVLDDLYDLFEQIGQKL